MSNLFHQNGAFLLEEVITTVLKYMMLKND